MGNLTSIETINEAVKGAWSFMVDTVEYFIPASGQTITEEMKVQTTRRTGLYPWFPNFCNEKAQ